MRTLARFIFAASLVSPAAFAQSSAMPTPACDGTWAIVRVSEIKPGTMDTFLSAVAAQKQWYASHGKPDKIFAARVADRGSSVYSMTEAMTYHVYASPEEPKHDAGFDAFVKLFSDSSTIKSTHFACFPKGALPL